MAEKNYSPYFAKNLNLLILQLGLTQQEFAARAEITPTILSLFLHEKSQPNRATLMRLSERFNVSLDWLLFDKGTMFGGRAFDVVWFQAVSARLLLAQMRQIGIQEAFEVAEHICQNNLDKTTWTAPQIQLDNAIWKMCQINEQAAEIYNHIMGLATDAERLAYLNQQLLQQPHTQHPDNWQESTKQHNIAQVLQEKLQYTNERFD